MEQIFHLADRSSLAFVQSESLFRDGDQPLGPACHRGGSSHVRTLAPENFFKYLREEYLIDALAVIKSNLTTPAVPSPTARKGV